MSEQAFHWVVAGGVCLAALAFVIVAVVAIVIAMVAVKIRKKLEPILEATTPIVRNVGETTAALKPKVIRISDQAVEVSQLVVAEAHRYSGVSKDIAGKVKEISQLVVTEAHRYVEVSKDVADRAKGQIAHIDGVVTDTVGQVQEAGGAVKSAVLKPVKVADGVVAGIRAGVQTFARGQRAPINRATLDEEMFI